MTLEAGGPVVRLLALCGRARYISPEFPRQSVCRGAVLAHEGIRAEAAEFQGFHERSPIHLSYAGSDQDLSGRQEGAGKHPFVLLPGRQDRRARRQRLRQIDAFAHHGRHRHRVHRRRLGRRGRPRRLPGAGAAARRETERARERHGGGRRQEGAARPLQRDRRQLFRRDRRRDGQAAGPDRFQEPLGPRLAGRSGDGRAALPGRRRRHRQALRRREAAAWRCAGCCSTQPDLLAARRADQPSRCRKRELAGRPSAQLSRRHPDRHP